MEPLNAVALAAIPKKRPNSARLLAKSYTCDRCLSKTRLLAKVQTLAGQDVPLRPPRLVATDKSLGVASRAEFPGLEGWH